MYTLGSRQQPRFRTRELGFISGLPTLMFIACNLQSCSVPSSNNDKLGLTIINKKTVLDQPAPDFLDTTFHQTNCILLGCATVRLEAQVDLRVAVCVWKLIPNSREELECIGQQ